PSSRGPRRRARPPARRAPPPRDGRPWHCLPPCRRRGGPGLRHLPRNAPFVDRLHTHPVEVATIPCRMPPPVSLANRPTPLPEPPRPLGARLRAWAEEALFRARQLALESWHDFRRRDRWFQWKVG